MKGSDIITPPKLCHLDESQSYREREPFRRRHARKTEPFSNTEKDGRPTISFPSIDVDITGVHSKNMHTRDTIFIIYESLLRKNLLNELIVKDILTALLGAARIVKNVVKRQTRATNGELSVNITERKKIAR